MTETQFPFRLSLYQSPPVGSVSIEQFELAAINRLQLLKQLELASIRSSRDEDLLTAYRKWEPSLLPLHSNLSSGSFDLDCERETDHLSHFILLLAYARTPELQRWFLHHELVLFRIRWNLELQRERESFVDSLNLSLSPLSNEQLDRWQDQLTTTAKNSTSCSDDTWYLVPFTDVLDLVAKRAVFLTDGMAVVPKGEIFSLVAARFRSQLEERLEVAAKALPRLDESDRLLPVLTGLHNWEGTVDSATSISSSSANGLDGMPSIAAADVDTLSAHFPPCMAKLHQRLRQDSHLKYGGRMQYGLFLKSIGLGLDEALQFWKRAFSSKYPEESFNRHYSYNIRHNYGQEGRRVNYAPYNCVRIITSNQPSGPYDCHGCPFKHNSGEGLKAFLRTYSGPTGIRLTTEGIDEICRLVEGQHYQVACSRLFELTRERKPDSKLIEPMLYPHFFYQQSIQLSPPQPKV